MNDKKALKFDNDKPDLTLVPPELTEAVAQVMGFGCKKYGRNNWSNGMEHSRVLAAAMRHINAFLKGQELDPESGMPHLWHAACNLGFLIAYQQRDVGLDNLRGDK